MSMRSEALYLVLLQVLPALLIAILLEASAAIRRTFDYVDAARQEAGSWIIERGQNGPILDTQLRWQVLYLFVGTAFVLGELACTALVIFGTEGWFVWLAGPTALACLLGMSLCAVYIPIKAINSMRFLGYKLGGLPGSTQYARQAASCRAGEVEGSASPR